MKIKNALTVAFCAALFLVLSAPAAMAQDRGKDEGLLKVELTGSLQAGQAGDLALRMVPAKGYKWNEEYPAKLEVKNGKSVTFAESKLSKVKGQIKADGRVGVATLKATSKRAGEEQVEFILSASVCDKETCHVIRKRVVPVLVVTR
ncbi:MAG: hypothetical protein ACI9OJ_001070 [Myxococcota bacterium]|jgi:hypothetical protein